MASSFSFGGGWDLGILSGAINYGYGQASEKQAWKRQKQYWRQGPSYITEGLRNAGINPLLAFAKGAPQVGAANMGVVGPGTDLAGSIAKASQAKLANAEIDRVRAGAELARSQAELARTNAKLGQLNIPGQSNQAIVAGWLNRVLSTADEVARDPRAAAEKLLNLVVPEQDWERIRQNRENYRKAGKPTISVGPDRR